MFGSNAKLKAEGKAVEPFIGRGGERAKGVKEGRDSSKPRSAVVGRGQHKKGNNNTREGEVDLV